MKRKRKKKKKCSLLHWEKKLEDILRFCVLVLKIHHREKENRVNECQTALKEGKNHAGVLFEEEKKKKKKKKSKHV